jgi:uncharacterized protein (DUF2249 family)
MVRIEQNKRSNYMTYWRGLVMTQLDVTIPIAPESRVLELFEVYPTLRQPLIQIIPALGRLRTEDVRHAISETLTIEKAAIASGVNPSDVILKLRQALSHGDPAVHAMDPSTLGAPPWLNREAVTKSLDARPMLTKNEHPKGIVMQELARLQTGQIFLLITPHVPGPLIEIGSALGCVTWMRKTGEDTFETYFAKVES